MNDPDGEREGVPDQDRAVERPSPLEASASGLVSRDYRPRTAGPQLVTSWPLGPAPGTERLGDADWTVETGDYVTLKRVRFALPYLGSHDAAPVYLNVLGHVTVDANATLSLWLEQRHLDGEHYDVEADLGTTGDFQLPMVEVAPDDPGAVAQGREVYAGFDLRARVDGGTATVDRGTAVQLFTE